MASPTFFGQAFDKELLLGIENISKTICRNGKWQVGNQGWTIVNPVSSSSHPDQLLEKKPERHNRASPTTTHSPYHTKMKIITSSPFSALNSSGRGRGGGGARPRNRLGPHIRIDIPDPRPVPATPNPAKTEKAKTRVIFRADIGLDASHIKKKGSQFWVFNERCVSA